MGRGVRLAIVCALTAAGLVGCAAQDDVEAYWERAIADSATQASSEFEVAVLSDGVITKSEYDEAVQRYVACMRDAGLSKFTQTDTLGTGLYQFVLESVDLETSDAEAKLYESADRTCALGTVSIIEPLYVNKARNPARETEDVVVARCLVASGLVDSSYDATQLGAERQEDRYSFDPEAAEYRQCMTNPGMFRK